MNKLGNKTALALWLLICGILVLDIGQACVRAQDDSSKKIKTHKVQIVNSDGKTVAVVSVDKKGVPTITLVDPKGNDRLVLRSDRDVASLAFYDSKGNPAADLAGDNPTSLVFLQQGKPRSTFGTNKSGNCAIFFIDKDQHARIQMNYDKSLDSSILSMGDGLAKTCNVAISSVRDQSGFTLFDANGKHRGDLAANSTAAAVAIHEEDDTTAWIEKDEPDEPPGNAQ